MTTQTQSAPVDDCFWHGRQASLPRVYGEYTATRDALRSQGLTALYGGTKGHGFWIREVCKATPGATGNPHFFSIEECAEALDLLKTLTGEPSFGQLLWNPNAMQ